jgi:hypothetical protein
MYTYYIPPTYSASFQSYLGCRQGRYVYVWGYTCYFPGEYVYYETASRYLDLAFENLWEKDWRSVDRHLLSAEEAISSNDSLRSEIEETRRMAERTDVEPKFLASSIANILGRMSTRLMRRQDL